MQPKNKNGKKKLKIVTKPYDRGAIVDGRLLKEALKFFGSMVLMMVAFVLLSSMMMWDSLLLRVLMNAMVLLMVYALFYVNGVSRGTGDVNTGEIVHQRREEGKTVSQSDARDCFHPLKGFVVGLVGAAPCLLCCLALACVAQQQLTGMGTLPSWVSNYEGRTEIGGALAIYHETATLGVEGVLRIIVRMMVMPVVSMIGTENSGALLLLERLSALVTLVPVLCYGLGYTRGHSMRTQVHSSIAASTRKKARREKKAQQARRQQKTPEQLN